MHRSESRLTVRVVVLSTVVGGMLLLPGVHAQECVPAPANLISWWSGDGHAKDIADGNDGSLKGGATFAPGKVVDAFSFDGNVTAGTRVQGPDDTTTSNLDITGPFTVDAWVDFTSVSGNAGGTVLAAKWGDTYYGTGGYGLFILSSGEPLVAASTSGWDHTWVVSPQALSLGFHHIAGVFTGAELQLYVDGVLRQSQGFVGPIFANDIPFMIGGYDYPARTHISGILDGLIDEVEVFNRGLSHSEIQSIYDAGIAGKCKAATLVCSGFEPPMANGPVTVRGSRALPLKAQLFDADSNLVTDLDLTASPVIQVWYEHGTPDAEDVTDEALPAGQSSEGNQFFFDSHQRWHYNLKTKDYSAAGTYTVFIESGDASEYIVDPPCTGQFVVR